MSATITRGSDTSRFWNGLDQRALDRLAFDTYVDVGLSYTYAARQLGVPVSTVRDRVRRHSLRRHSA
jgi:hypothetical protein